MRRRRFASNEALYRSVNERIEGVSRTFAPALDETLHVICECGRIDCVQEIEISVGDYERVRSEPTFFIVVPGHETADVEVVVEQHESYNGLEEQGRSAAGRGRDRPAQLEAPILFVAIRTPDVRFDVRCVFVPARRGLSPPAQQPGACTRVDAPAEAEPKNAAVHRAHRRTMRR